MLSWSTGKDAAWCLHRLRERDGPEVVGLLTTVTPEFGRVSVHGTRRDILREQARRLGLPVWEVELPYPCPNEAYEAAMSAAADEVADAWQATHAAFGDLFLEDVREYRERLMAETPLEPVFPLWGDDTTELARSMVAAGVEAVVVSAAESSEAVDLVGSRWDPAAIAQLDAVDPCGERGEFHTCVVSAPGLARIPYRLGEVVSRNDARYADVIREAG